MTKIDHLAPGQQPIAAKPDQKAPEGSPGFQEVLARANKRLQKPGAQAARGGDPLAGIQGVKPALPVKGLDPVQVEGVMRAERALEVLESYEKALADEKKPLKEIMGLVNSLDAEVLELTKVLDQLDPQDGLYGLLSEVAVTGMVQSIKFNRGDYLPEATAQG